jgi:2-methylisocitrate lyase-like PEP mutase family enzyme
MSLSQHEKAVRFRALQDGPGVFILPNPWDVGSAKILAGLGFKALATSSAACAAVLGKKDGELTGEEALAHGDLMQEQRIS